MRYLPFGNLFVLAQAQLGDGLWFVIEKVKLDDILVCSGMKSYG